MNQSAIFVPVERRFKGGNVFYSLRATNIYAILEHE